jgi:hypothetical protein
LKESLEVGKGIAPASFASASAPAVAVIFLIKSRLESIAMNCYRLKVNVFSKRSTLKYSSGTHCPVGASIKRESPIG